VEKSQGAGNGAPMGANPITSQVTTTKGATMTTAVSLFAGVGGFDLALERAGVKVVATVEWDKHAQKVLQRRFPNAALFGDIQGVTGEQLRAAGFNPSNGIITGGFWQERVVDFSGKSADSLTKHERKLLSSKMCLVYFLQITEETWPSSLKRWSSAGIASRGGCLMLNTSEFPNDAVESSLSDVLETQGDHLKKYSLSQKAAQGILRRATRRGKTLPPALQQALESVAQSETLNSTTSPTNQ